MKTIMLVGHPSRAEVMERLLGAGFFVLPAHDGASALSILNALRVDGFVIDVSDANHGGESRT